jgi:hypothetical protein
MPLSVFLAHEVYQHYASMEVNRDIPYRLENIKVYTEKFAEFAKLPVPVKGLGWDRFYFSDAGKERVARYAAMPTPFPPIILNPYGMVHDGAHRAWAADCRGDNEIEAFVPILTDDIIARENLKMKWVLESPIILKVMSEAHKTS